MDAARILLTGLRWGGLGLAAASICSFWYLGAAFGNKFAGVLAASFGEGDAQNLDQFFGQQSLAVFVIAGLFLALCLLYTSPSPRD